MDTPVIIYDQVVARGCGLDVHKDSVVATIQGIELPMETETFSTDTSCLEKLRSWLRQYGITHVAMESTSIYRKPIFNVPEEDFEILLVNARHVKNVPGRKTDKADSRWLSKLLLSGLLKGSFIPPRDNRELRELFRYKRKIVSQIVAEKNRTQKILEDANIKLSSVVSDVFGVSGTAIIEAIIEGQTDPVQLAFLAKGNLVKKIPALQKALNGKVTAHHRFMLRTIKKSICYHQQIISDLEIAIDEHLESYQVQMQLLQTIPGVSEETAGAILAETGSDMNAFADQHHLASWAGISPGNNESAGKKKVEG